MPVENLELLGSITGAAGSFFGARSDASSIRQESEFRAQQLETNSRLARIQARSAAQRGKRESEEELKITKLLVGRQRANLAAQGIDVSGGSALDLQLETAEFGAVDALIIRNNAFREEAGFRIESEDLRSQAEFSRVGGKKRATRTLATGGIQAAKGLIGAGITFKRGRRDRDEVAQIPRTGRQGREGPLRKTGRF